MAVAISLSSVRVAAGMLLAQNKDVLNNPEEGMIIFALDGRIEKASERWTDTVWKGLRNIKGTLYSF